MEALYVPTEGDFKKWIKEAVSESLQEMLNGQTAMPTDEEPLLSRKQVAEKLDISLVTLRDWVKHGLPSHKQRGKVYFLYSEVIDHIKKNKPAKYFELAMT